MQHITLALNDKDFARANAAVKAGGFGSVQSAVSEWVKNFSDDPQNFAWHAPIVRAGITDAREGRVLSPQQVQHGLDQQYQAAVRTKR